MSNRHPDHPANPAAAAVGRRWLILSEGDRRRWGGDLRRAFLLRPLARRTGAVEAHGWTRSALDDGLRAATPRRWPWQPRSLPPRLASTELLAPAAIADAVARSSPTVLDIHDHPVLQQEALGVVADPSARTAALDRYDRNVGAFAWLVAPSASFAELAGLDPARRLVAPNGTDTHHVRPGPFPSVPTVGMVSGAAPGRGIEMLVTAAALARDEVPGLELRLWLAGPAEELARIDDLIQESPWIQRETSDYGQLGAVLARATVLCVPHPPGAYMDSAVPVKLLDSMAAGRPVVVTPRTEMRSIVERHQAGLVARGDEAADFAEALVGLLRDAELATTLGQNGRQAAETFYDWSVIGEALADEILARVE